MANDLKWMRLALAEAKKGERRTWPNPWVGCVIVKGGKLIAKGFHEKAGFPHAEIEALKKAGSRAKGATMYVTLEPCNHQGKTGPCSQAILRAGITRVVAAAPDPNTEVHGGNSVLRKHGVSVGPWMLRAEAEAQNADFFASSKMKRPVFVLKAGATLDGKTATSKHISKWITSEASRKDAKQLRGMGDGVLVGAGTVAADNPGLLPLKRNAYIPWRIVLDPRGRLSGKEKIFRDRFASRSIWITGPSLARRKEKAVSKLGAVVVRIKAKGLSSFCKEAAKWLGQKSFRRVLVEGGSQTLGAFMKAGLADQVVLYLAPTLMGGDRSKGIFGGKGPKGLEHMPSLKNLKISHIGHDLKVEGDVHRDH